MNELHLFAGAGGGILGGMLLGHTCVCAVEIEPYCRKVLLQRQRDGILPKFPIWDDVRTFDGTPWRGLVDVVCGGFPCQDISTAGKGNGLDGERSGLWREMARIAGEVRSSYIFVENSPAITARGLGRILGELATLGYDAKWCVLGADSAGAPHRRERFWLLAANPDSRIVRTSRALQNQGWPTNLHLCRPRSTGQMETPWSILTEPCSVAYGMAGLVDELRPYGNGQVPSVVALAWKILTA
jgi:DNA (cytosine-5)-methyltransferase 1